MPSSYDHLLWTGKITGLPARFEDAGLNGLPKNCVAVPTLLKYGQEWGEAITGGLGMLHLGTTRSWKSYSTAVVARTANKGQIGVEWVDVPSEFARMGRDRYSDRTRARWHSWTRIQMLVLDDFATVEPGSYGHELLSGIISARFNAQIPTHFTGNLAVTPDTVWAVLNDRYGPMVARRIEDMTVGFRSISA